jgi:hypothetical protein
VNPTDAATVAIFQNQMNSDRAIRYVQRVARVSERVAQEAVRNASIWYKVSAS